MAGHDHSGGFRTAAGSHRGHLGVVLGIYGAIIVAELIGARISGSLALLAEAGHMAVDASGILVALIATFLAARKASSKRTYGMMRAEIVAVLVNCLLLFGLAAFILLEAIERWVNPPAVAGGPVIAFAVVGLVGASASLMLLRRGAKESLNVKAAFLEVLSDGIGSAAIILSGVLNLAFGWDRGDALAAAAIGLIILPRAFALLKQAVNVIMQGVPEGIDADLVRAQIEATAGVSEVHSLHVWGLTSGVNVMTAHVVLDEEARAYDRQMEVLDALTDLMRQDHGIEHCTFQMEAPGHIEHEGTLNREL